MKKITLLFLVSAFLIMLPSMHSASAQNNDSLIGASLFLDDNDITLSVSPNPFTDRITLTVNNTDLKVVEIYNVLGKKVAAIDHNIQKETVIDVSNLTSGVYLLRVTDLKNNVITKKIIKQ